MANYYEILKVSPKASRAEIKSAYRRLARKLHPDKNFGSEETARAFAKIAEAWEVLRDPKSRSIYDKRLLHAQMHYSGDGDSLFESSNMHARRWRQLVYEHRYNEIIDRMIAEERRESMALQKIIFPLVALFVSCLAVAMFKPQIFENSAVIGKIILVSLFIAGLIHLWGRIKDGLERFTYGTAELHESILDDHERKIKPFSRVFAAGFLVLGISLSFGLGLVIGHYFQLFPASMPAMFSSSLKPEFVFYPPIFVLFVDLMHGFALRVDV
ncbi:MAG TPA: J domain-containing protein [Pyrinomonadaceae bacterium]